VTHGEGMEHDESKGGGGIAIRAGAVRIGPLGRFVSGVGAESLTEQQRAFVEAFCSNGGDAKRACRDAGYLSPTAPSRLLGLTQVRHAVSLNLERQIKGEGASLAWGCVLHILRDPSTPSAVRFQASRFVLESAGLTQVNPKPEALPLASMSLADLEGLVEATRQSLASVVELETGENEPVSTGPTPPAIATTAVDSIDAP
jgi:hypothetical protein